MTPQGSVLFVCLGNICRSPLAEGLFIRHAKRLTGGDGLSAQSAGLGNWHAGNPPHPLAIAAASGLGADISGQRATRITHGLFDSHDLVLAMDRSVLSSLRESGMGGAKTALFMEYAGLEAQDVPDPYGKDMAAFERVASMIDAAMPAIISRMGRNKQDGHG